MTGVRINFPGLLKERLPSGAWRYRVRVQGSPGRRIRLHVTPDHPQFGKHYHAARLGIETPPEITPKDVAIHGSMDWLALAHLDWLEKQVDAGQASWKTLKKRRNLLARLREHRGDFNAATMAGQDVIEIRDDMAATPSQANAMVEAIRVMYRWADKRGVLRVPNPAAGVEKIKTAGKGAIAWTADDLRTFCKTHKPGTKPHLCLTILLFTGCRIGDAAILGRQHETTREGIRALSWQPEKKGSAEVNIPLLPQLYDATRRQTVQGQNYLLNAYGRPYSGGDTLSQIFSRWCREAGLPGRTAHGVRKSLAGLLAEVGCSQYQIMSILAHTEAKTSEVYTEKANRWRLAVAGMKHLEQIEW